MKREHCTVAPMKRIYNFSAGPATLPTSVLQEASRGILELDHSGMSILELSHRGKHYEKVHFDARDRLLKMMNLSSDQYTVLFLGGGASMQFAMLPMNFLKPGQCAEYVHTGEWSGKAMKEAKFFGNIKTVASSEAEKFASLPSSIEFSNSAAYAHITTNNTIEGTEFSSIPSTSAPLVADMSSDFLAKEIDYSQFSMVYAGAQKNAGPAGVTLVVARKSWIEMGREDVPAILSYRQHMKNDSLYNTPPAFGVYVFGLVLKWLEGQGGLKGIEALNRKKASMVYEALDEFPDFYDPAVKNKDHRSLMNVTFRIRNNQLDEEFLKKAQAAEMDGLKGHRSVGGFRASIYNAFPLEGCARLAQLLRDFAKSH
jgi:phosphoserine aminotransferase